MVVLLSYALIEVAEFALGAVLVILVALQSARLQIGQVAGVLLSLDHPGGRPGGGLEVVAALELDAVKQGFGKVAREVGDRGEPREGLWTVVNPTCSLKGHILNF